uniref:Bis(5'-nucleosyl)-tetraphosphatase [asymmetrical] n=1 Tax=uncultured organism TaxID=155900 RepID=M1Q271_9ZZZZ|nr:protein containing NUDIX hydrolase, core domain protein [uncultured organism]
MDKMIEEISAGVIIYRETEPRQFLLLHYPAGHWDFPKGHVEENETAIQTALRELEEETSIVEEDVELKDDFEETIDYFYKKRGDLAHKKVIYLLGESDTKEVEISNEHQDYIWLPYKKALKKLTFRNAKNLLEKAKDKLEENT